MSKLAALCMWDGPHPSTHTLEPYYSDSRIPIKIHSPQFQLLRFVDVGGQPGGNLEFESQTGTASTYRDMCDLKTLYLHREGVTKILS